MVDNIELKKYIYDNISKSDYNHHNIINYVKSKKIDYSQNNNGIFLNISKLNDEDLFQIKALMLSESYIKENTNLEIVEDSIKGTTCSPNMDDKNIEEKLNENINDNKKTFKKLKISNSIEKDIIKYSKIYNLINELYNG